ncbi:MAG: MBL fold metallo-hydrolase [Gemmatimonadetes bacterium]|nr:MBL fold metallo-hydrolase [Gemmatimonadota bacterium]
MLLKRFYDEGLAQASYLVGAERTGEALVVDPLRDLEPYLAAAADEELRITHVTETHIHADFLSGARNLVRATGARLLLSAEGGPDWQYRFASNERAELLRDGDSLTIGEIHVDVRHMPGHTPEHLVFLVTDTAVADRPLGIFTGDFVFVGDVGRPDLLERAAHVAGTMESSARALFQSLRSMREYPEYLQLWPGHGAGSACGKSLGALPSTTLGYERLFNWAFQVTDEEEFVRAVLAGQPEAPKYFGRMKLLNRDGPPTYTATSLTALDGLALAALLSAGATTVLDTRSSAAFTAGFIPGTINIPAGRSFTTWAGSLLSPERDIVLIAESEGRARALVRELSLIGVNCVTGWADSAIVNAWRSGGRQLNHVRTIASRELAALDEPFVIDVRAESEWNSGHIPGARHIFLADLVDAVDELPRDRPLVVACQGGSRSSIGTSLLRARGFENVINFSGGFAEWQKAGLPVETGDAAAPSR